MSLLTDESTAVRFRLDGAAKDVRLLQLRALQLYGLRDALPLLPSASLVDALVRAVPAAGCAAACAAVPK